MRILIGLTLGLLATIAGAAQHYGAPLTLKNPLTLEAAVQQVGDGAAANVKPLGGDCRDAGNTLVHCMTTSSCCRSWLKTAQRQTAAWLVASRGNLLAQLARYPEALANLDQAIELANGSDNVLYAIVTRTSRADVSSPWASPRVLRASCATSRR